MHSRINVSAERPNPAGAMLAKKARKIFMQCLPVLLALFIIAASFSPLQAQDSIQAAVADTAKVMSDSTAATVASAATPPAEAAPALPQDVANIIWLCLCGFLVFFMQAGFAMVESGMTRAKNAVNIMMKNLLDFCFGAVIFWAIGYAIMYSSGDSNFLGFDTSLAFLGSANAPTDMTGYGSSASWLFQVVFAATAATIVSGAMAERTKLISYIIYSCVISAVVYPISGHWIWGGGWLSDLGLRDFAGSTVVHSVGGWASLAGAIIVGPRLGKYNADGSVNEIKPHNMPLAALGVFILWFGWYGFNPGSTLTAVGGVAHIAVTTTLAAATGAIGALITSWIKFKKPDLSMTLNGTLAGLVAITAPCASVSTGSAALIGLLAGILVFFSCLFFERTLKVDDPVGAISVHGVCGAFGTLCVGLFGQRAIDIQYWGEDTAIQDGLFFGGGFHQLGVQAAGVFSVLVYVVAAMFVVFYIIKAIVGLRVSDAEQRQGLDLGEHNNTAYGGFVLDATGDHAIIVIEEKD
jgi:Amt family ammonium transporter